MKLTGWTYVALPVRLCDGERALRCARVGLCVVQSKLKRSRMEQRSAFNLCRLVTVDVREVKGIKAVRA